MPGRMEFEFELGGTRKGRPRDDGTPMRILVLGDFSGRPAGERPPLATRPTHKVDVDTLDAVMQRIGPRLQMGADEIAFRSIDDFHPDALFRRAAVFEALRRTRTNPPSSSVEVAEDLGRLLGKPAEAAAAPRAPAGSIEAMIHDIVAPHIVKGASPKSSLAAVDASITIEMRTVLHHPSFQALESAWRGAQWLTANLELDGPLQLHLFDVAREELIADIVAAQGTLSQTGLYRALVDRWRNVPGSEGWSVLAALMAFNSSSADLGLLAAMGVIASNAGAPLLAGADPSLMNGDDDAALADW